MLVAYVAYEGQIHTRNIRASIGSSISVLQLKFGILGYIS